jgi:hypothetical protein
MENIIWFWNLVHYNVFVWRNKVTKFFLYPFFKFLGSSTARNFYNKRGVSDPDLIVKDALLNPSNGTNSIRSGGTMGVLLLFICLSVYLIYTGFFDTKITFDIIHIVIIGIIIIPINYFTLFKQRKYLTYFEEFTNLSEEKSSKYSWICFGFILLVMFFLIGSFIFMDYMFHHKN